MHSVVTLYFSEIGMVPASPLLSSMTTKAATGPKQESRKTFSVAHRPLQSVRVQPGPELSYQQGDLF